MDTSENSRYGAFVLWGIIITGTLTIGNSLVGLNPITPLIHQTYSDIFQSRYGENMPEDTWTLLLSLTMSMTFIGGLVGSLLVKPLLRLLTRKRAILAIHLTNSIGLVVAAVGLKGAMSYEMVISGRFLVGISVGLGVSIIPLFINELSVPQSRQFYGGAFGAMLPAAGVVGTFFAWSKIFGSDSLVLAALLIGLMYTTMFLICYNWIPETPYQTYIRRGTDDALLTLRKLRLGNDEILRVEIKSFKQNERQDGSDEFGKQQEATIKEIFSIPQYRKHFLSVVLTFGFLTAGGFSNVLSFSDKIFLDAGIPQDIVTPSTMGIYLASAVASVVAIISMRKFDSRTIMIFFNIVVAFSHALMTASIETSHQIEAMSWVSMAAMCLYMIAYGFVNTATYAVMGTLCIDRTRSFSLYVGGAAFWFFAWFVGFISPYLSVWIKGYAFLVWMGVTFLSIAHYALFLPRTKEKTEDEIQAFFKR